jgi:hypothetical protein
MTDASPIVSTPPADRKHLKAAHHVLHFASVFELNRRAANHLRSGPWVREPEPEPAIRELLEHQYTSKFRNIIFVDDPETDTHVVRYNRILETAERSPMFGCAIRSATVIGGEPFFISSARLFAFGKSLGHLGLLTFEVQHACSRPTLDELSNLMNQLRHLKYSKIRTANGELATVRELIAQDILPGFDLGGSLPNDYLGSRLKTYLAVDLEEPQAPEVMRELLYDLGCVLPIGSAGGDTIFTPSRERIEQVLGTTFAPLKNFMGLTLLDTFVAVGSGFLDRPWKHGTWARNYFGIYAYNLFVKCRCQQLMAEPNETTNQRREACRNFLGKFNLVHISDNFIPSILNESMRAGLEVKQHMEALDGHVHALSKLMAEDQQRRQALLLGLVSVGTVVQAIPTYLEHVPKVQEAVHMSGVPFWTVSTLALLLVGGLVLTFLFPEQARLTRRAVGRLRRKHARAARKRAPAAEAQPPRSP